MGDEVSQWRGEDCARPIETSEESPVCLLPSVGNESTYRSSLNSRIVSIDGIDVRDPTRLPLPGIRVGDGEGTGYVLSRASDDQFVFVPDAGYVGETHVVVGIEEGGGRIFERLASILVQREPDSESVVTFANGSQFATVVEGMEAAIVGALTIDGLKPNAHDEVRIIETGSGSSPERFSVVADKLLLKTALESATEDVVRLKVVVVEDDFEVAGNELEIRVQPAMQAATARNAIPLDADARPRLVAENPASFDQFHFRAASDLPQVRRDEPLSHSREEDETSARTERDRVEEGLWSIDLEPASTGAAYDPFSE